MTSLLTQSKALRDSVILLHYKLDNYFLFKFQSKIYPPCNEKWKNLTFLHTGTRYVGYVWVGYIL